MSDDPEKRLIGHAYAITFDLGNGRNIQVNGNFYVDDTTDDMNKKLDSVIGVLERQRAKIEAPLIEANLKTARNQLSLAKETQAKLEAEYVKTTERMESPLAKASTRIAESQKAVNLKAQIETQKVTIMRIEADIAEGEKSAEELRQKAA